MATVRNIQISEVSKTDSSISVSWTVGKPDGVEGYIIEYHEANKDLKQRTNVKSSGTNSYQIDGLKQGVLYTICVLPVSKLNEVSVCKNFVTDKIRQGSVPNPGSSGGSDGSTGIIVGATVGAIVLILAIVAIIAFLMLRKRKVKMAKEAMKRQKIATIYGGDTKGASDKPTFSFDQKSYMYNTDGKAGQQIWGTKGASTENQHLKHLNNPPPGSKFEANRYTPSPYTSRKSPDKAEYEKAYPNHDKQELQGAVGGQDDGYLNPVMLNT